MNFANMSVWQLSNYAMAYNFFLKNSKSGIEGILIGILDMSESKNCVKILAEGDSQYWSTEECIFVRAERRQWQKIS